MVGSSQTVAGVQRKTSSACNEGTVWQITVAQHSQTYEIMHLASVSFFK